MNMARARNVARYLYLAHDARPAGERCVVSDPEPQRKVDGGLL